MTLPCETFPVLEEVHGDHVNHVIGFLVTQVHHDHLQGGTIDIKYFRHPSGVLKDSPTYLIQMWKVRYLAHRRDWYTGGWRVWGGQGSWKEGLPVPQYRPPLACHCICTGRSFGFLAWGHHCMGQSSPPVNKWKAHNIISCYGTDLHITEYLKMLFTFKNTTHTFYKPNQTYALNPKGSRARWIIFLYSKSSRTGSADTKELNKNNKRGSCAIQGRNVLAWSSALNISRLRQSAFN